jgi:hypothetical protein
VQVPVVAVKLFDVWSKARRKGRAKQRAAAAGESAARKVPRHYAAARAAADM